MSDKIKIRGMFMNPKPTIAVIEDVPEMANLIQMYLTKSEMDVNVYSNAEDALAYLEKNTPPSLFILDLNLPGMSGFDFLNKIRNEMSVKTPIVIVSARDADEDVIKGLNIGADEFVTKPFSPKVLVAKVQAILRRHAVSTAAAEECINFGEYTILLNSNVLKKGTEKIPLSTKEYAVLEFIVKNAGETLSPEVIFQNVWKTEFGDLTAVAVYVQRLRKKIEEDPASPTYIKTIFGQGYSFNKESIHN